jgi:hypothetical protein
MKFDDKETNQIRIAVIAGIIVLAITVVSSTVSKMYNKVVFGDEKSVDPIQSREGDSNLYKDLVKGEEQGIRINSKHGLNLPVKSISHPVLSATATTKKSPFTGITKTPAAGPTKGLPERQDDFWNIDSIFFLKSKLVSSSYPHDDVPVAYARSDYNIYRNYLSNHGGIVFWTDCRDCNWSIRL